jgi:hypothetical protein
MRTTNFGDRTIRVACALAIAATVPVSAHAQAKGTGLSRTLAAIASTPLGALTPVGPSLASRRDDAVLLGFRLQYGSRALPEDRSLTSYAVSANAQIEGGAVVSAIVGQQRGDASICDDSGCDSHRLMAGLRYSSNFVTTRPFLKLPFFSENDATGTAAVELGAGWANTGLGEKQHWTADVTVPLSVAVGQNVRFVTFATPTVVMAWGTTDRRWSRGQRFMVGGGITAQEIGRWVGVPGLDLSVALQRAFSPFGTGLGVSLTWMRVP